MIAAQHCRSSRVVTQEPSPWRPIAALCALALAVGFTDTAGADGIEILGETYGPPGPTNSASVDYILIDETAYVEGDVTNAPGATVSGTWEHSGIGVYNGSTVTGALVNRGGIGAADLYNYAIEIRDSTIGGGIRNDGDLASSDTAVVVDVRSGAFSGGIVNTGGIAGGAEGIAFEGLALSGGISNSGSIASALTGIYIYVDADTDDAGTVGGGIHNAGTIASEGNAGVRVYAGTLSGGIANSGAVRAPDDYGIYLEIGALHGGVANSGTVASGEVAISIEGESFDGGFSNTGSLVSADSDGVALSLVSFSGGIASSGAIVASAANGLSIEVDSFSDGIDHSGSIISDLTGIRVYSTSFDGGISNSGSLSSDAEMGIGVFAERFAGGIDNAGSVFGGQTGVFVEAAEFAGGIVNSGFVGAGTETGLSLAVGRFGGGIVNSGSIAGSTAALAVRAAAFEGDIVNLGSLASGAGDGLALEYANDSGDGSTVFGGSIVNSGSIDAAECGICVAGFSIAGGIANTGTLRGGAAAIDTRSAGGPTAIGLSGGAVFGDILLSERFADRITVTGGSIQGSLLGSGDDFVDFFLATGTFSLSGEIAGMSRILVDPGTLHLDGTVARSDALVLDADTTLVLSPTSRVSVTEYIQNPSATLSFTVAPDGSHGILSAQKTVDLAGFLDLPRVSGLPAPATPVVFRDLMSSAGGFSGAFAPIETGSIFLQGSTFSTGTTLGAQIRRLPFDTVLAGLSGNASAVAGGLERAYPAAYARMDAPSVSFYSAIFDDTVEEYTEFLGAVGGSTYANALTATLGSARLVASVVDRRLDGTGGALGVAHLDRDRADGAPGARSAWAAVMGNWGDADGDESASGFSQTTAGLAVGLDYRPSAETLVGAVLTYLSDRVDFDYDDEVEGSAWQIGAYGQYDAGRWYARGLAALGWGDYEGTRRIRFGGVDETATGDWDGTTYALFAESGLRVRLGETTLTPVVGLGYMDSETDAFTESGSELYGLRVEEAAAESLASTLGVRMAIEHAGANGVAFTGEARALWQHEYLDAAQEIDAAFAVLPGSGFVVSGTRFARDSAVLGLGVKARIAPATEIFLDYDARLSGDYTANALLAGVRVDW